MRGALGPAGAAARFSGRSIAAAVHVALLVIGGSLLVCNFPLTPTTSSTLRFERSIELPRSGLLSALDYLVIRKGHVLIASISSGAVIDVAFDSGNAAAAPVRVFRGKGDAHGIAVVNDHAAFVTRGGTNVVDMFDPGTLTLLQSLPVPAGPDAVVSDPSTGLVYAASTDASLGTVIDASTGSAVGTVHLLGVPEFAVLDPATHLIYQNLSNVDAVSAIDLKRQQVTATWQLSGCEKPSGMAIDSEERRLFIVCSGNARMAIVDLDTHRITSSLPVGRLSDTVAFDDTLKRLYIAGGAGELVVITRSGSAAYRVVDRIRTRVGSHTVAVDPVTHKVFLASAGIVAAPRLTVFSTI